MLKLGNLIINLSNVAYVDLNATKALVSKDVKGVRIYFNTTDSEGNLHSTFFAGYQAECLQKYFNTAELDEC